MPRSVRANDPTSWRLVVNDDPVPAEPTPTFVPNEFLSRLVGFRLYSVQFVMDYVQLRFDGPSDDMPVLNCDVMPAVERGTETYVNGQVGYGESTTYGALATAIARPGAARAVGSALGANPVCVIVPCHRVLPAGGAVDGDVGGYAGGPAAKALLLALESRSPV